MLELTRRQLLRTAAAGAAGAVLAACARPTPTPTPRPAPATAVAKPAATAVPPTPVPRKVSLTVSIADWNSDVQDYIDKEAVAAFQARYPGREVKVNYANWARYNEELTTAFAGGVPPDVFQGGAVWAPQMAKRGWALPLDELVRSPAADWDWNDFYPSLQNDVSIDGKVVAVPYRMDTRPFWYREDILQEAKAQPPTTWQELATAATACTRREGTKIVREGYHFADPVASNWQNDVQAFVLWLHQGGGVLLTDDGRQCKLDEQPAIDTLQFIHDLVYKHQVMPYPGFEPQGDKSPLMLGIAAMQNGGTDIEVRAKKYSPETAPFIKTALPLKGPGGQFTHTWVNKYFIAKISKEPKEAWALLEFLTSRPVLQKYCVLGGFLNPRKSAAQAPELTPAIKLCMEATALAKTYPKHHRILDMLRPLAAALGEALSNKATPKVALTAAAAEIRKIIAEG